jgi:hypothetical protein
MYLPVEKGMTMTLLVGKDVTMRFELMQTKIRPEDEMLLVRRDADEVRHIIDKEVYLPN